MRRFPRSIPKSLTFIGATLDDNPALDKGDPNYRANLMNMQLVDRERLLGANWKIRPAAGLFFQRSWCTVVDIRPAHMTVKRGWDLAATAYTGTNDPDWTVGVKMGRTYDGQIFILDVRWFRGNPGEVKRMVVNTASQDGTKVAIRIPQDPGQGGKSQVADYASALMGYAFSAGVESGEKETRFSPFSAQAEHGKVRVLRADWNDRWFSELEAIPQSRHDDAVDATSTAFAALSKYTVSVGAGMVFTESREQDGWAVEY
jgi:predicted phage terminase large subunit-like protein